MASPTPRSDEPDPQSDIHHLLDAEAEGDDDAPSTPNASQTQVKSEPATQQSPSPEKSSPVKAEADGSADATTPQYTATTTTTRRNANGSVSTVYSGNKIRHLKKEDGVPLWRSDIQYDFLKHVFNDDKAVFHKASDKTSGNTFADIYLDAMAKSSKCSKILKEKLLTERPAALNMAMVCLLVNVGRMNTTLNFFPEMRAQLRTYHSIPSLQAHQDPNAYKQLQDAPRLKSILKGATEDVEQPSTIEDIKAAAIPRTNPVNLIFVLAQYAPKISGMHFDVPRDFFDLVMKSNISSESRARAFLWLMWWYLESDFSLEDAQNNPYGPGQRSKDADETELPIKCPQFKYLTPEEESQENVDTAEEKEFGEQKQRERLAIINGDLQPVLTGAKRSGKKTNYQQNPVFAVSSTGENDRGDATDSPGRGWPHARGHRQIRAGPKADNQSDTDRTRSLTPSRDSEGPRKGGVRIGNLLNDDSPVSTPSKGPGRGNWRRNQDGSSAPRSQPKARDRGSSVGSGPASGMTGPHGYYLPLNGADPSLGKRSRPPTTHQLALERYRKERVYFILDRGLRKSRASASRKRQREFAITRAWNRCKGLTDGWDSEEEAHVTAAGRIGAAKMGLAMGGFAQDETEKPDWGAESEALAKGLRRMRRRLDRWEGGDDLPSTLRKVKNALVLDPDDGGENTMDVDGNSMAGEEDLEMEGFGEADDDDDDDDDENGGGDDNTRGSKRIST